MMGTSFSVTEATRCTPPRKTKAEATGHHGAYDPRGDAEGVAAGLTDGVGLNHTADKAQGQGDGHRKEPRQEGAELVLKSPLNVVNRAAGDGAVRMDHPGLLGQNGLGVNGGHPEKSDDPHPEDGTGPPTRMALQEPMILPVPTWAAMAVVRA